VSARVEHVSLAATPCTMQVRRKRGAWAVIPLASATCDRLTTYLAGRAEGPLLLDAAGDALDRFDVVRITQRLARRGGLREPATQGGLAGLHTFAPATPTATPEASF
jgi:hypothetical protein